MRTRKSFLEEQHKRAQQDQRKGEEMKGSEGSFFYETLWIPNALEEGGASQSFRENLRGPAQ